MKIGQFAIDSEKELKGVWLNGGAGLKLLVARMGNPDYQEYTRRSGKDLSAAARAGTADQAEFKTLARKATARHVLLDWKNLQEEDGSEIKYSPEKAEEIFEKYPEFFELVLAMANDRNNYRPTEESKGNL
jgi:hypothetical protein